MKISIAAGLTAAVSAAFIAPSAGRYTVNVVATRKPELVAHHQPRSNLIRLKTVTVGPADATTAAQPAAVVRQRLQFTLSNGRTVRLRSSSLRWSWALATHAIVLSDVPQTTPDTYVIAVLGTKAGGWEITSLATPTSAATSDSAALRGLHVPDGRYTVFVNPLPLGGTHGGHLWYLTNPRRVIVIARFPRAPFAVPAAAQHRVIDGVETWITTEHHGHASFLFAIEGDTVVVDGGSMTPKQARALFRSLPWGWAAVFPFPQS